MLYVHEASGVKEVVERNSFKLLYPDG